MKSSIIPGVKICTDLEDIYGKISINTGVYKQSFDILRNLGLTERYSGHAPCSHWRVCSSLEIESLFSKGSLKHGFVRFSKVPSYITDEYFWSVEKFRCYDSGIKKILLGKYLEKIQNYLCKRYLFGLWTKIPVFSQNRKFDKELVF